MHPSLRTKIKQSAGFSLIELSIVLLIAGLMVAGAFALTNNMQKQRNDQTQANQTRTVISALERYLNDNQGLLTATGSPFNGCAGGGCTGSQLKNIILGATGQHPGYANEQAYFLKNYLPTNFNLNGYTIGINDLGQIGGTTNTSSANLFRGLVLYQPGSPMDDSRLARVSTLIGAEGGMISNSNASLVTGAYGAWSVNPATYGLTGVAGTIAAYTTTQDAQMNTNLLSRIQTGNGEANTMEAPFTLNNVSNTQDNGGVQDNGGAVANHANDLLINPPNVNYSPPSGIGVSEQTLNGVLNMTGAGFFASNVVLQSNMSCYDPQNGGFEARFYRVADTTAAAAGTTTSTSPLKVGIYQSDDTRLQNMIVYGSANGIPLAGVAHVASASGTHFTDVLANGNGIPTLLQCQYVTNGVNNATCPQGATTCWIWQVAAAPPPASTRSWQYFVDATGKSSQGVQFVAGPQDCCNPPSRAANALPLTYGSNGVGILSTFVNNSNYPWIITAFIRMSNACDGSNATLFLDPIVTAPTFSPNSNAYGYTLTNLSTNYSTSGHAEHDAVLSTTLMPGAFIGLNPSGCSHWISVQDIAVYK